MRLFASEYFELIKVLNLVLAFFILLVTKASTYGYA